MSASRLAEELVLEGWKFWLDGEQLRFRAPRRAAGEAMLERLRRSKAEIVALLCAAPESLELAHLSYNQRALWFLWALAPHSSAYNQSHLEPTDDAIPAAIWLKACSLLAERHAMLRTRFPRRGGEPIQQVLPNQEIDWREHDLTGLSEVEREAAIARVHQVPFDLENGPVARFRWFVLSAERRLLMITMHHIACDGWSIEILRHELAAVVQSLAAGAEPVLPRIEHSYHDYVRWQRELLEGPAGERLCEFWQKRLETPLPVLQLPTDFPRPPIQNYQGDGFEFEIPAELAEGLRALATAAGCTLHATLLAAWFALLFRYTGQREMLIGTPTAGRSRVELARIVGYFVDPVVIRGRIEEGRTFFEFLGQMGQVTLEALEHSDFPFALLVEKLRLERDPARSPLFDVSFNFLSRKEVRPTGSSLADSPTAPRLRQADGKFDLTLSILEDGAGLRGSLGYNAELFAPETIQRLSGCLLALLECVARDARIAVERIPLFPAGQPALFPALTGREPVDPRAARTVQELFEAQVALGPERPAVTARGFTLSYAELNAQANRLAHWLRQHGVREEARVAVSTGRSTGFAAALLGVLKAGGAYVPIDPAHPRELRDHFVRQAGAVAILTESRRGGGWADSLVPVLDIDAVPEFPNTNPETNLGVQASLGSLAYVLYTSGSTGRPKGVAIEHRSLSNYVASMMEDLEIAEGSSFAFVSTIGADLGNTAIFPALCSGGCLHILGEELLVDGAAFFAYLAERQIDYLKIVPSHFAALAAGCERSFPMPRRALILGGEGASARWVERLLEEHPGCRIFNHYGPTETTVGVLTYGCDPAHGPLASATLPLRRPVAGTQIYLLDAFGRSVPQGFDGEVAIGGVCVAREYIGEPELTAERFVEQPGAGVLYRTGDRARQLANGDIELLGRQDRQVGVRGYRVELGHVESILREHPAVEQCIVLPVRKDGEVVYLAAYAACGRDSSGTRGRSLAAELDALARRKLPLYMTPQRYRILDRIPLTGNGKIDVARLEALDAGDAPAAVSALPRDAVEMRLSDLWAEVLGVETVGPQDDFFRLGGHSLLCVRLAGRIHEEFDRRVPLSAFLACRTVEQFAAYLREEGAAPHSLLIPIRPRGELAPLILLPGAGGSAVYFYFLARHLAAERPVWAIQGQGLDGAAPIPERIEEMAAQSIAAIRNQFDLSRPVCLAGHSLGGLVAFEMARQLCAQGIETAFLGVIDNAAPGQGATECEGWPPGRWLRHIALRLEKLYRVRLGAAQDSLTEEELIDRMLAASLLPLGTRKEYFRHFLDVYRANAMAAARYRPIMDALPVTLTLFRADEPDAELSGAPDGRDGASEDDALGWGKFVAPQPHLLTVPGTHITMLDEPHVQELARRIEQRLEHAVDNARDKRNGAALSSNGTIPIEPSLET